VSCSSFDDGRYFVLAHILEKGLLIAAGIVLAWKLRKVSTQFSEAQCIAICLYNCAFVLGIMLPIVVLDLANSLRSSFLIRNYALIYLAVSTATIMALPKFLHLREAERKLADALKAHLAAKAEQLTQLADHSSMLTLPPPGDPALPRFALPLHAGPQEAAAAAAAYAAAMQQQQALGSIPPAAGLPDMRSPSRPAIVEGGGGGGGGSPPMGMAANGGGDIEMQMLHQQQQQQQQQQQHEPHRQSHQLHLNGAGQFSPLHQAEALRIMQQQHLRPQQQHWQAKCMNGTAAGGPLRPQNHQPHFDAASVATVEEGSGGVSRLPTLAQLASRDPRHSLTPPPQSSNQPLLSQQHPLQHYSSNPQVFSMSNVGQGQLHGSGIHMLRATCSLLENGEDHDIPEEEMVRLHHTLMRRVNSRTLSSLVSGSSGGSSGIGSRAGSHRGTATTATLASLTATLASPSSQRTTLAERQRDPTTNSTRASSRALGLGSLAHHLERCDRERDRDRDRERDHDTDGTSSGTGAESSKDDSSSMALSEEVGHGRPLVRLHPGPADGEIMGALSPPVAPFKASPSSSSGPQGVVTRAAEQLADELEAAGVGHAVPGGKQQQLPPMHPNNDNGTNATHPLGISLALTNGTGSPPIGSSVSGNSVPGTMSGGLSSGSSGANGAHSGSGSASRSNSSLASSTRLQSPVLQWLTPPAPPAALDCTGGVMQVSPSEGSVGGGRRTSSNGGNANTTSSSHPSASPLLEPIGSSVHKDHGVSHTGVMQDNNPLPLVCSPATLAAAKAIAVAIDSDSKGEKETAADSVASGKADSFRSE
jgi:hypothetical protein